MPEFRTQETDGVLTITFNRDEKLNALSPAMLDGLQAAIRSLEDRDDLAVLVIASEGRYFTAGVDALAMGERMGMLGEFTPAAYRRSYRGLHRLFDSLEAVEKPTILAAHARCLGAGVELAVSCDFRLAAAAASFWLPEIPNLGVIPGSGGISRMTRLAGPHWARWLAMAACEVDAERALLMGLVHDVYPDDTFRQDVQAFAARLAAMPRQAVGLAKLAIDASVSADRTSARDFDRLANSLLVSSDEYKELVASFAARTSAQKALR